MRPVEISKVDPPLELGAVDIDENPIPIIGLDLNSFTLFFQCESLELAIPPAEIELLFYQGRFLKMKTI